MKSVDIQKCILTLAFSGLLPFLTHAQTSLVPTGSVWKYLDDGSDQGTGWKEAAFDDSAWGMGPAPLGYGDGDEATTNRFGPDPNNKYITTYYRSSFNVANASTFTNLIVKLLRDDGGVVYLNGTEIFRSNMPTGAVTYTTLAPVNVSPGDESTNFYSRPVSPSQLVSGVNVLAVEIHQVTNTSSDISFDLALIGNLPPSASLVPAGSFWKFWDDGADPGITWRDLLFDDSGWAEGPGQLGFGDGDEATHIRGEPDTNGFITVVTTYFRRAFEVANPLAYSNLVVRLLRDDGGIVYLNGVEIFRSNMGIGPVTDADFAASVVNAPQESEFYATNVSSSLLLAGTNILAVEIHQANNTSSDVSFDLELVPNVPRTPPIISLTSPTNNATFLAPTNVTVNAQATDFDGLVSRVEFYLNSSSIGQDAIEPFGATAPNLTAGSYTIRAVATDNSGLMSTSAPVNIKVVEAAVSTTLIATGSVWKYLDTGINAGTAWKEAGFDDGAWDFGPAELGYGDDVEGRPEATVINGGPTGAHYITTYFRHQFQAQNISRFTNLVFRVVRDDGCVAYLNGTEVFRMNMPAGPVTFTTPTSTIVGGAAEYTFYSTNVRPNLLVNGANLLAVELHQSGPTSSDASFDLGLDAIAPPNSALFLLKIDRSGPDVVITWNGSGLALEQASDPATSWTVVTGAVSGQHIRITNGGNQLFRVRRP